MKNAAPTRSVLLLAGALLLGGCATVNDVTMRVMATSAPALAVVGERVLSGEVLLYSDRSGKLQLRSESEPALSCMGAMRYTATSSGTVNLSCSDGRQAQLPFTTLGETSGYGSGRSATGMASFTYGLDPERARAWLSAPPGKRLVPSGDSLRIE